MVVVRGVHHIAGLSTLSALKLRLIRSIAKAVPCKTEEMCESNMSCADLAHAANCVRRQLVAVVFCVGVAAWVQRSKV